MNQGPVITIDGPAASGKTSVSRELANQFGWVWVSTGAFYRGLAAVAVREKVDLGNHQALADLALSSVWTVQMTAQETSVFYKKVRITEETNKEETGMHASRISQYPEVRAALLSLQRACATANTVLVAEGRDCGTVVFPQAIVKVYLTANSESRALRRSLEQEDTNVDSLIELQKKRDAQDGARKVAPMQIADGALVIDSSGMALAQVVEKIEQEVRKQFQASGLSSWFKK